MPSACSAPRFNAVTWYDAWVSQANGDTDSFVGMYTNGLNVSGGSVHVWCASIEQSASRCRRLAQTLSPDEKLRAEHFRFEKDRRRFVVGRGVLRSILGSYLGISPSSVRFHYEARGKPVLAESTHGKSLYFNMSHSQGLALYALTRRGKVGIDLERLRHIPEAGQIAGRLFSPRENAVLRVLPESGKQKAFFDCWSRKEAYLKATGVGLIEELSSIEVSLAPGESPRLLSIGGDWREAARWSLHELTPVPRYVGALAVEKPIGSVCEGIWQSGIDVSGRPYNQRDGGHHVCLKAESG